MQDCIFMIPLLVFLNGYALERPSYILGVLNILLFTYVFYWKIIDIIYLSPILVNSFINIWLI